MKKKVSMDTEKNTLKTKKTGTKKNETGEVPAFLSPIILGDTADATLPPTTTGNPSESDSKMLKPVAPRHDLSGEETLAFGRRKRKRLPVNVFVKSIQVRDKGSQKLRFVPVFCMETEF